MNEEHQKYSDAIEFILTVHSIEWKIKPKNWNSWNGRLKSVHRYDRNSFIENRLLKCHIQICVGTMLFLKQDQNIN